MGGKMVIFAYSQFKVILLDGFCVMMVKDIVGCGYKVSHSLRFICLSILSQGEMSRYT